MEKKPDSKNNKPAVPNLTKLLPFPNQPTLPPRHLALITNSEKCALKK